MCNANTNIKTVQPNGLPSITGITRILGTFGAQCSSASPSGPLCELNHPLDDV